MKRVFAIAALAIATTAISTPASANWWSTSGGCKWKCTSTNTTSGGGTTTGGSTTTSGGSTSGTQVPEPGMLGLFGAGLLAVGYANRRRRRTAN